MKKRNFKEELLKRKPRHHNDRRGLHSEIEEKKKKEEEEQHDDPDLISLRTLLSRQCKGKNKNNNRLARRRKRGLSLHLLFFRFLFLLFCTGGIIDSSLFDAYPSSSSSSSVAVVVFSLFSCVSLASGSQEDDGTGFVSSAEGKKKKKKEEDRPLYFSPDEEETTEKAEELEVKKEEEQERQRKRKDVQPQEEQEEEKDLFSGNEKSHASFSPSSSSYLRTERARGKDRKSEEKQHFSEDKLKMLEGHFQHIIEEFNSLSSSSATLSERDLFPDWEGEGRGLSLTEEEREKKKEKENQQRKEKDFLTSLRSSLYSHGFHQPYHELHDSLFSSFQGTEKNLLYPFSSLRKASLLALQEEARREELESTDTENKKRKKEKEEEIEEKLESLLGWTSHHYYKNRNEKTCEYRAPLRQLFDEMQRLAMERALLERKISMSASKSSSSSGFFDSPVKPEENLLIHWDRECLERLPSHLKSLNSYQGLDEEEKDEMEIFLLKENQNFSPLHALHRDTLGGKEVYSSSSSSSSSSSFSTSALSTSTNALNKDEEERERARFSSSPRRKIDSSSLEKESAERRTTAGGSYIVYRKGVFYSEFFHSLSKSKGDKDILGKRKEEASPRGKAQQASSSFSHQENDREEDDMTRSEQQGRSLALSILAGALGVRTPAKDIPLLSFGASRPSSTSEKQEERQRQASPMNLEEEEEEEHDKSTENNQALSSSSSSSRGRRCNEECQRELERLLFRSSKRASMHATFYPLFDVDIIQIRHLPEIRKKLGLYNSSSLLGFLSNAHEEKGFTVGTKFSETAKCIRSLSFDKIGKTQQSLEEEDQEEESATEETRFSHDEAGEQKKEEEDRENRSAAGKRSKIASSFNDPDYNKQWHHMHEISPFSLSSDVAWKELRSIQSDDAAPVVALLDTGCVKHEDYYDSNTPDDSLLWKNKGETNCADGTDEDNNGYIDDCWGWNFVDNSKDVFTDDSGHGTSLASLLVAKHNDSKGGVGVMPVGRVMCLKVGKGTSVYLSAIIKALQYAIKQGAKICLIAHTFAQADGVLESVFKRIEEKNLDVLTVTAAGTSDCDLEGQNCLMYPASYKLESMIVVGSSKLSGGICCASNWGKETIDVYAPGNRVWGGTPVDAKKQNTQCTTCHAFTYGTSAAAAAVAGVASMTWMYFRKKQPEGWTASTEKKESLKVKKALLYSSTPAPRLAGACKVNGVVNMYRALHYYDTVRNEDEEFVPFYKDFPSQFHSRFPPFFSRAQDSLSPRALLGSLMLTALFFLYSPPSSLSF